MPSYRSGGKAFKTAFLGLMLALALALSFFESLLPALPFMPVGVKLGLSNIVTMYCLFFLGGRPALAVAFLKSCFVFLMRGPVGAALSLSGGLFSIAVMVAVKKLPSLSNGFVSVAGAIAHNIGQLVLASVILKSAYAFYYIPVMIISGAVMGSVTGILLRLVMPYLQNADKAIK